MLTSIFSNQAVSATDVNFSIVSLIPRFLQGLLLQGFVTVTVYRFVVTVRRIWFPKLYQ